MITCSNSPALGSGMPNHYVGDLLHTMAISGLSRVRTELVQLAVVQSLQLQHGRESLRRNEPDGRKQRQLKNQLKHLCANENAWTRSRVWAFLCALTDDYLPTCLVIWRSTGSRYAMKARTVTDFV